jgi:hypothetical protein
MRVMALAAAGLAMTLVAAHSQNGPTISVPRNGTLTSCDESGTCRQTKCSTDLFRNETCTTTKLEPPPPPGLPTKREARQAACETRERERQWRAYCRPEVYVDRDGLQRYRYARRGCDVAALTGGAKAPWLVEPYEEKCRQEAAAPQQ